LDEGFLDESVRIWTFGRRSMDWTFGRSTFGQRILNERVRV
jgi:hypothetical protein